LEGSPMDIVEEVSSVRASESSITSFEAELGWSLPADYRSFLVETNGGRPEPSTFEFTTPSGQSDSLVDWLYSLSDDPYYSLRRNREIFGSRIPDKTLSIGCDPFGNQILMNRDGEILFWDHELETTEGVVNVHRVASSFTSFVEMFS